MLKLQVDGREYNVEFRHATNLGKRPQLSAKLPIKGITTCVISSDGFIAIENVVCILGDNFSRQAGRTLAFNKVINRSGALKGVRWHLVGEYNKTLKPSLPVKKSTPLSPEEKQSRIDSGAKIRTIRIKTRVLTVNKVDAS